jgi:hypothetical protein
MVVVIAIWYLSIPFVINTYGEPKDVASAGDMFGGINALFSGLALAGVIFAVWLQTLDVRTNQQNLEKTIESNKFSLEIMALSSLIQEADSALQRYERWEKYEGAGDYSQAKSTVREKLKLHREKLEEKLAQINST